MRWGRVVSVVVAAVVIGGCGGSSGPSTSERKSSSRPVAESAAEARIVCAAAPRAKVARDLGLPPGSSAERVAARYARGYDTPQRRAAVRQACLEAIVRRGGRR